MLLPTLLVLAAAEPASAAAAVEVIRPHVVITTERPASIAPRVLDAAAREARTIWSAYADVEVRVCAALPCTKPPRATGAGVQLVIVDRMLGPNARHASGLGEITFLSPESPDNRITVSTAAVLALAASARLGGRPISDLPTRVRDEFIEHALGRAIAHELGHYLLRSKAHTASGLMRARFEAAELMDGRLDVYTLDASQVDRLRRDAMIEADSDTAPEPASKSGIG